MAQLVAGDSRCFPDARAQRTKTGWVVLLEGPAERVSVPGVPRLAGPADRELATSAVDAFDSLDRVSRIPAHARAARALADHARCHPVARLLCRHGLPLWHGGADPCRSASGPGEGASIDLGQIRTMMAGLRGLEDLARHVAAGDGPADPAQVDAVLSWPILPSHLTKPVRAETERDGWLVADRCRQILATGLRVLQDGSRLQQETVWVTPHRLQTVTYAHSDLALYVAVLTARLLAIAGGRPG